MLRLSIVLACLCATQSAFAHATPVHYDPGSASVLDAPPAHIQIRFSERVDAGGSSITVYGPDGALLSTEHAKVDREDAHVFALPLATKAQGTYTVSWQIVSADDGHFTKGAYLFSVGKATAASAEEGQFQIQHRSDWPEAITILLELLGGAILLGCLVVPPFLTRRATRHPLHIMERVEQISPSPGSGEGVGGEGRRAQALVALATLLLVFGGIAYLLLESSNLAFDRGVNFTTAFSSFLTTVAGRAALTRTILGLLAGVLFFIHAPRILKSSNITRGEAIIALLLLVIALLRARVSHAAASAFLPTFSIFVNAVHLLAKDLWIGGVIAFALLCVPALIRLKDAKSTTLAYTRFGDLLLYALAFGGTTGAYIVWLHLKGVQNLFTTHWGGYCVALISFGLILLVARLYHHQVIHPALARECEGTANKADREAIGASLPLLWLECLMGILVLLFSSILLITTPPLNRGDVFSQSVHGHDSLVTFGEDPSSRDQFLVTVTRTVPISATGTLTVSLENREKGIGPIVAKTETRFPGGVSFPFHNLTPAGEWTVEVIQHQGELFDAVGSFTLHYPRDIEAVHAYNVSHEFGLFEAIFLVIALVIIALTLVLARKNARLRTHVQGLSSARELSPLSVFSPWITLPMELLIMGVMILTLGSHNHGGGGFVDACTLAGGLWHENVPMQGGKVTSDIARLGCMIGSGRGTYHFIDPREFFAFTERVTLYATLKTTPVRPEPGRPTTLFFSLKQEGRAPAQRLTFEHDRILHVVIINQDLQTFAHVHAEDSGPITQKMIEDGTFPVRYTFPKSGRYIVAADWTIGAQTFFQQFAVEVPGTSLTRPSGPPSPESGEGENGEPLLRDMEKGLGMREVWTGLPAVALAKAGSGFTAHLSLPSSGLRSNIPQKLTFTFDHDGVPVTDLAPYLSAPMHIAMVKSDLSKLIHAHAELPQSFWDSVFSPRDPAAKHIHQFLPDRFGPKLVAYVLFPVPGQYVLFGEVRRSGKVLLTRFTIDVR